MGPSAWHRLIGVDQSELIGKRLTQPFKAYVVSHPGYLHHILVANAAQLIVATLAQRYDVELPAGAVVESRYVMAYQPKELALLLHPRGQTA